jgi:hypothetical protein
MNFFQVNKDNFLVDKVFIEDAIVIDENEEISIELGIRHLKHHHGGVWVHCPDVVIESGDPNTPQQRQFGLGDMYDPETKTIVAFTPEEGQEWDFINQKWDTRAPQDLPPPRDYGDLFVSEELPPI